MPNYFSWPTTMEAMLPENEDRNTNTNTLIDKAAMYSGAQPMGANGGNSPSSLKGQIVCPKKLLLTCSKKIFKSSSYIASR